MEKFCCEAPTSTENQILTLSMLESGSKGVIKDFVMNCEDNTSCRFIRRLKEIGLHNGATFEILKNNGNGEISVFCEGATLALGRGMAEKINVEVSNGTVMEGTLFDRFCKKFRIKCTP
jgi:Fe2+ transport system protein FeoA